MSLSCAQDRPHGDGRPWDPKSGPSQPQPSPSPATSGVCRCVCCVLLLRSRRVGDPLFRSPADFLDQGRKRAPYYAYSVQSSTILLVYPFPRNLGKDFGVRTSVQAVSVYDLCPNIIKLGVGWSSEPPNQSIQQKEETEKKNNQTHRPSRINNQGLIQKENRPSQRKPRCCGRSSGGGGAVTRSVDTRSSFRRSTSGCHQPTPTITAPGQNTSAVLVPTPRVNHQRVGRRKAGQWTPATICFTTHPQELQPGTAVPPMTPPTAEAGGILY